jgi:fatty-acyl-CoA synthase
VSLRPGAALDPDALVAHSRAQHAAYKAPRHVVFVDEVQRSPVGKADYGWARAIAAT